MSTAAVLEGVITVIFDARCALDDEHPEVDSRLFIAQMALKAELDRLTTKPVKKVEEVKQVQEEVKPVEDAQVSAPGIDKSKYKPINKARIAQLWAAGKKPKEIADAVGCSEQTVRNWVKKEAK